MTVPSEGRTDRVVRTPKISGTVNYVRSYQPLLTELGYDGMPLDRDLARRQRRATLRLGFIAVVVLVVLSGCLVWDRMNPDPEDIVRDDLTKSAGSLSEQAGYALTGSTSADQARQKFAEASTSIPLYRLLGSRVVPPSTVQWDAVLGSSYHQTFLEGGEVKAFHTCFRLTGRTGREGQVSRTAIACPGGFDDGHYDFGNSTEISLPDVG